LSKSGLAADFQSKSSETTSGGGLRQRSQPIPSLSGHKSLHHFLLFIAVHVIDDHRSLHGAIGFSMILESMEALAPMTGDLSIDRCVKKFLLDFNGAKF